jgi:ribosomal-protein-alanine N-acetyltransferase
MTISSNFSIKRGTNHDSETFAIIHAIVLPSGWSAAEFHELLSSEGVSGFFSVTKDGLACGILLVRSVLDECEIITLGVLPEMQRHGVATAMLKHAIESVKPSGVHIMHLEVREDNTHAITFYERLGFLPTGRRKDYYATNEGRKDAILMSRTIVGFTDSHAESSF